MASGVYKIYCTANKKSYVGSSTHIEERWTSHKNMLKRNVHHSKKLQLAYNKYGSHNFIYEIVDLADEKLDDLEQFWIDRLDSYKNGFNCRKEATVRNWFANMPKKEYIVTFPGGEEVTVKGIADFCREHNLSTSVMLNIAKYKCNHHHSFHCRSITDKTFKDWADKRNLIISKKTPTQRAKSQRRGLWRVTCPNGKEVAVKSLTKFCKENNLSCGNMYEVAFGRREQHNGYTCSFVGQSQEHPLK